MLADGFEVSARVSLGVTRTRSHGGLHDQFVFAFALQEITHGPAASIPGSTNWVGTIGTPARARSLI